MIQYLTLLRCRLSIGQLVRNPVSVKKIQGMSIHKLSGTSFFALEIFNVDSDRSVDPSVEGDEEEVIVDGIKIPQRSFAIARIYDVTVVFSSSRIVFWALYA